MPRKIIQDIKPQRSLKSQIPVIKANVVVPVLKLEEKTDNTIIKSVRPTAPFTQTIQTNKLSTSKIKSYLPRRIPRKLVFWLGIAFIIFVIIYWLCGVFASMTVTITPKHQAFTFTNEKLTASKATGAVLPFEIMIMNDTLNKDITLTEKKDVTAKAKGSVIIYNEYSAKTQNLSINTRLVDDTGKIYMTDVALSVPGYTKSGSKIVPGSITTTVTASLVGPAYNGDKKDFNILGFKGNPKYTKIYAKSKTAFSGGQKGVMYVLSADTKGSLSALASSTFRAGIEKKLEAQIPKEYIIYRDLVQFSSSVNENFQSETPNVKVPITGTLKAMLLKQDMFSNAVIMHADSQIKAGEFSEISIENLRGLKVNFTDPNQDINKDLQSVNINITGTSELVWHPDQNMLVQHLLGVSKTNLQQIFIADPGIAKADAVFFPPWQNYAPSKAEKIHIILQK